MSNFDENFSKRIKEHRVSLDTNQLWIDIQKKKKKRKFFFFLWSGSLLAGLAIILGFYFHSSQLNNELKKAESKIAQTSLDTSGSKIENLDSTTISSNVTLHSKLIENEINKEINNPNSSLSSIHNSKEDKNLLSSKSFARNQGLNEKKTENSITRGSSIDPKQIHSNALIINNSNKVKEKISSIKDADRQIVSEVSDSHKLQKNESSDLKQVESNQSNSSNLLQEKLTIPTKNVDSIINTSPHQVNSTVEINNLDKGSISLIVSKLDSSSKVIKVPDEAKEIVKSKLSNPWFLQIAIGADHINRKISFDSSTEYKDYIEPLYAFHGKVQLEKEIWKGVCLTSAVAYNHILSQDKATVVVRETNAFPGGRRSIEYIDINGKSSMVIDSSSFDRVSIHKLTNYQRIKMLQVQLGLKKRWERGRFIPYLGISMAMNLTSLSTGKYYDDYSTLYNYKELIKKNIGFSYCANAGLEFALNSRSSFGLEFQNQKFISSFNTNKSVKEMYSLSGLGLTYTLKLNH